tara:strand:+ start:364 stop:531 length:168 start_codon:yes stop_codon:yes gene_type:complete
MVYLTVGDSERLTTFDYPNYATAATLALRLGAKNARSKTMKAFKEEAFPKIVKCV